MPDDVCRLCAQSGLREVIDLGSVPSIHILRKDGGAVPMFPIHVKICPSCGLVQMRRPKETTAVYEGSVVYTTSHLAGKYVPDLIDALKTFRNLHRGIEIGCNDGHFLEALKTAGFSPLTGIEPNARSAAVAKLRGFPVETTYFTSDLADALLTAGGPADFIVARHVLEHVDDIVDFLRGVHRLLRDDGVFLLELPYPEPGFESGVPNVLWDEHISYFAVPVAVAALRNHGFTPRMYRYYTGGALVYAILAQKSAIPAQPQWGVAPCYLEMISSFSSRVETYRQELIAVLEKSKSAGFLIAVYGAGFRSATTLNTMKIAALLDCVIDDRADLAGYVMPGTSCAIYPLADTIATDRSVLLLLGVGAENEAMITYKARAHFKAPMVPLSLVYPGDLIGLCRQASAEIDAIAQGRQR